jgi:hypothetical protein
MSGQGCNPALGEAGSAGGDLECSEGVARVVGLTDLGGEHEAGLLPGRAGPSSLVGLCGSKVAKQSLRGVGIGRSAGPRRLRLGDQQPSLDMASVPPGGTGGGEAVVGAASGTRGQDETRPSDSAGSARSCAQPVAEGGIDCRGQMPHRRFRHGPDTRSVRRGRIVWKVTPEACLTIGPLVPSSEASLR